MDITPLIPEDRMMIDSYGPGRFTVSEEIYTGSVIVFPDKVLTLDAPTVREITLETVAPILEREPLVEILLIGAGDKMALPPREVKAAFQEKRIGVEPMATGPACRTYNILLAEGRRVAAALIPLTDNS